MALPTLTVSRLQSYANDFLRAFERIWVRDLFGVTDGKAVGTYVEARFHNHLAKRFRYPPEVQRAASIFRALESISKSRRDDSHNCHRRSPVQARRSTASGIISWYSCTKRRIVGPGVLLNCASPALSSSTRKERRIIRLRLGC